MKSQWEELFAFHIKALSFPAPTRQYKFHPDRRWTCDFAYPDKKLLIEIEGGMWIQGRHNRAAGYEKDMEKYNTATMMGYSILRFSPGMVKSGQAANLVGEFISKN